MINCGKTLLTCAGAAALFLSLGAGDSLAQADDELGASIVDGTCARPGAAMIADIGDIEGDDDAAGRTPTIAGTPVAGPVYEEDEGLAVSLADLTGTPHVVVVRASEAADAPIVACGEIAGKATDERLLVQIAEVDGSGITGIATFGPPDPYDDDGDLSEVLVQVQRGGGMASTPAA